MKILNKAYWKLVAIWFIFGIALNIGSVMYTIRTGNAAVLLLALLWWAITLISC